MTLPNGWEEKPLGNFFEFQGKSGRKAGGGLDSGKYKFFTSSDIQKKFINDYDHDGEYLVFGTGGGASIHYCNEKFSTSTDCFVVKVKAGLKTKYAYYFMREKIHLLEAGFRGAGLKHVSKDRIEEILIRFPTQIKTQERIIALLEKAEQIKNWRKEADGLSKDYLKSVFVGMFGDPVKNPKNWKIEPLSECVMEPAKNGFFAKNKDYVETGTPIIWIGDFIDLFYANTLNLKRVMTRPNELAKNQVCYGDVLFVRSSLTIEGIGKASLIPENLDEPTIFECHIIKVRLNVDKLNPEFFRVLSETPFFRAQIMKNSKTATMTTISQDGIMDNIVILPPIVQQLKFAKIAKHTLAINKNQIECKKDSENLFNSLMQKAFKGELV